MRTCRKCGGEIPGLPAGVPCPWCGHGAPDRFREIDWLKVATLDDVVALLRALDIKIAVGSEAEKRCERFLKP